MKACTVRIAALFSMFFLMHSLSYSQSLVDGLAIEVRDSSREFSFTNKVSAFYYGETHSVNRSGWQGFNVMGQEFVNDYELRIDGKTLDRKSSIVVVVYPDYVKRLYGDGIVEEIRVADSLALFSVTVTAPQPIRVDVIPDVTDARSADDFEIGLERNTAVVARKTHLRKTSNDGSPVWLAIRGTDFRPRRSDDKKRGSSSPLRFSSRKANAHAIAFSVAGMASDAKRQLDNYLSNANIYHHARRMRMERLLRETFVTTENKRFDKALAWAKLSLDALIMNQRGKGIFAGLPWFNNYWGRDTFIALPGATLVQGRFREAKEILLSFAAHQQLDANSADYGRIPNIVTTTDKAYNTADGTPRFVMMARELVERSGDTSFVHEIYPTIHRSIEGTLKHHCDSLGFLTHGDQETWMDAAGPDGCWSPRGNRANDIQALWAEQLRAGIWFAVRLSDSSAARRWNEILLMLQKSFTRLFLNDGIVADHLDLDGSRDRQLRPNQVFCSSLLDDVQRAKVLASVVRNLTYPYGVASLSQLDENFHPYHQNEPLYPKDAAYHNGTVWTWLQGPVISELCRFNKQELASALIENTVHQILDRGAAGTQSELVDAIARPGEIEPRLSGTFSQAWNLAEFIRNFYDDFLGIRVDLLKHHLVLRPRLPRSLGSIQATINLGGRALPLEIQNLHDSTVLIINGSSLRKGGTAEVIVPAEDGRERRAYLEIPPGSYTTIRLSKSRLNLYSNGSEAEPIKSEIAPTIRPSSLDSLELATPVLTRNLRSLKGPDYPLLSLKQIKASNPASEVLVSSDDPISDDVGTGAFAYPTGSPFVKGSFDLKKFTVRFDHSNAYFDLKFRALSNPGWHPEYGFQLTYVAIAIDEDGIGNSGQAAVGHNANFVLQGAHAYEKLLLIGGGVRLEDKAGKILCAYIPTPADISNPLGDIKSASIRFAIPLSSLGKPSDGWTWTVLVGAQDDHGGAGLGEFRTVNARTGEWNGGGRRSPADPNVYDIVTIAGR